MKDIDEVVSKININGCIQTIQTLIEGNLYTVGGIAIGIALSQVGEKNKNNSKKIEKEVRITHYRYCEHCDKLFYFQTILLEFK